jgi:hypothetical protein
LLQQCTGNCNCVNPAAGTCTAFNVGQHKTTCCA